MENKCINLFLHGLCMWECHLSLGSVVPRNKRRSTTSLSVFIQWHTVLFNVYQARDGRGLVSQPSWFWLLVVRGGHQHTAEFWGAVGESSRRGGRSHSECQRKGEHASSEVYAISGVMFEYALIWSPFFPFLYRLSLMLSDWSMPIWWCWVMSQDKPHQIWGIWTSPQSRSCITFNLLLQRSPLEYRRGPQSSGWATFWKIFYFEKWQDCLCYSHLWWTFDACQEVICLGCVTLWNSSANK